MNKKSELQKLRFLRLLIFLTFCSLIIVPAFSDSTTDNIERLKGGVVKVISSMLLGGEQQGTGVIIRRDSDTVFVATAAHVVAGATDIEVEFYGLRARRIQARVLAMEGAEDHGLAVLSVLIPKDVEIAIHVLPLVTDLVSRPGDQVAVIGFPRQFDVPWMLARGELVGRRAKQLVFTANIDLGNSGGPLIRDGQVIGIVTQKLGSVSFAVPALIARYILESWGVKFGMKLRSKPASLPPAYVAKMVRDRGFSHPYDLSNKGLSGSSLSLFENEFESRQFNGEKVILDQATGLMWQQDGSEEQIRRSEADAYIEELNIKGFAGFRDWRLPTVEELASLLEPLGTNDRLYISPLFVPLLTCWTSDYITLAQEGRDKNFSYYADETIIVNFSGGSIEHRESESWNIKYNVRAVRSLLDFEIMSPVIPVTPELAREKK